VSQPSELPNLSGRPKQLEPVERVLLAMSYGVHVIGSRSAEGALNVMLADWVMQVSFRPRLVVASIENDARTLRFIQQTGIFSVNLLHQEDGEAIARKVVMPSEGSKIRGRSTATTTGLQDKLAGLDYVISSEDGVPLLNDALGWFLCDAEQFIPTGDHTLVVGRVTDGDIIRSGEMLIERELGWEYGG